MREVYLDWAATSPLLNEAADVFVSVSRECSGNPSSIHAFGERARARLEKARAAAAGLIDADPDQLYFTSGASESNNMILLRLLKCRKPGSIAVSAIEHASVHEPAAFLQNAGWQVTWLRAGPHAVVPPEAVQASLRPDTALVSLMLVNNETGALQPVAEAAAAVRAYERGCGRRIHVHTDVAQAIGKIPFSFRACGADSASFSAHKFGGPKGVGFLALKDPLDVLVVGGGQERGLRPGTENVAGIASAVTALEKAINGLDRNHERASSLMKTLIESFADCGQCRIVPSIRSARPEAFSPFIISLAFPPLPGEVLVRIMNDKGFAISTGSACSARKKRDTRVLENSGIDRDTAFSSVRVSIGDQTSEEDMEAFITALREEIPILFKAAR